MHQGFEKNYSYLLTKLIPRHLLSPERLAGVDHALGSGIREEMVKQAYLALEELASREVFRQKDVVRAAGEVRATYLRTDTAAKITLVMKDDEWARVSGAEAGEQGLLPSVLAGIISSLSLNDQPRTLSRRIGEILDLSGRILPGSVAKVLLLREAPIHADKMADRIKYSTRKEIDKNEYYQSCLESGVPYSFVYLAGRPAAHSFFMTEKGTKSFLLVPLTTNERTWGVLEIHLKTEEHPDRESSFNYFLLGQGIVRLLENNMHLEKMVSIDRLTQLHNRNYYDSQLPLEMERAIRNRKNLAFLIMDIDDFKRINDRYGHDVGDEMLKLIARVTRDHLRKIDLLFRYGGEEFIVLLPGAGKDAAERTAERIREVVSKAKHTLDDGREIGVTISIGGCIFPNDGQKELDLFRKADSALYVSKREGKNRVTFYEAGEQPVI
jgi:diguanylate cyclase (GGDEF)-like protein